MRNRIRLQSVGLKLFLIIFIAIVVCVLAVGLFSYSTSKSIIKDKVSESTEVAIRQSAGKLDLMFQNYEDMTMQIMLDTTIQKNIDAMINSQDTYERFQATQEVSKVLQMYVVGNDSIVNTNLIAMAGDIPTISVGTTLTEPQNEAWFKEVVEQDGKLIWIPVQAQGLSGQGNTPTFGASRVIKNTITNKGDFVLVMEYSAEHLAAQLADLQIGDGSRISIVDMNSAIVYDSDVTLVGKPSAVKLPAEGQAAKGGSMDGTDQAGREVLAIYDQFEAVDNWRLLGAVPVEQLVKDAGTIRTTTWIIAAVAALLAVGIGLFVIRIVARPLVQLRNLMNEGERGNLMVRSTIKSKDEIGQLSNSFNLMMAQITALVQQTTQSAQDVLSTAGDLAEASRRTSNSAKEIASATEEIASGATSLAIEAERGTDLTGEIELQMKQVMASNSLMSSAAREVERSSMQGTDHMKVLINKTTSTEEMTRSMVEKVERLQESTESIRKILDVLQNLTKQTNILSLNAAIEAARAGEAGKGFMVVADEIRKLADQSRQSIDVVGQITVTIQSEIEQTVGVLTTAYPMFQEQIVSVKEADAIFAGVHGQMSQFIGSLNDVTEAIGKLEHSQQVLNEAMSNVSAVAEESSATSEEVASLSSEQTNIAAGLVNLSEKLETVSQALGESLSRFTTK
ncbi:methyl-accepting chemotaxis protein [Paenibacillus methanolicus]|uniref:Methyl-accepting chemotaxis protein n=1 Tax=Paenibacillus methanolicus TaxID=582686 RepID=A0A5S5C2Y6_9BACL|nr:methyl-accepting chemotaxis protein [Paenibacillus methanolicus]TYP73795.1 methyl-accepting chemotaxis protein [Paenibacillus methanolicus]